MEKFEIKFGAEEIGKSYESVASNQLIDLALDEAFANTAHKSPPSGYPKNSEDYADPSGYRYPLTKGGKPSKERISAAWRYINMPKNAKEFDGGKLSTVKSRIKEAGKKIGLDLQDKKDSKADDMDGD